MTTTRRTFRPVALAAIAGLALSACSLGVGGPAGTGNAENSGGTEAASEDSQSGGQKDSAKDEGGARLDYPSALHQTVKGRQKSRFSGKNVAL